ncbi:MAG: prepilin-type N-terminal cleavage/methylation domain-containing protein [Thermogutta sp.]
MMCGLQFTITSLRRRQERRGVTLLELLVVVTILLILLAVMVPRLRPMMEQRRVREASRTVSGFFYAARSRAMETGRPVGVAIERLKTQPEAAVTLRMVEEPPPYAGDVIGARAIIRRLGATLSFQVLLAAADVGSMITQKIPVMQNDIITFESQAVSYRILGLDQNQDGTRDPDPDGIIGDPNFPVSSTPLVVLLVELAEVADTPWPSTADPAAPFPPTGIGSRPVNFQIARRPESTAAAPVRLPSGTVIDLYSSGTDSMALLGNPGGFVPRDHNANTVDVEDPTPVVVLFAPEGRVQRVFYQNQQEAVTESVYFLIGRWERMPAQPKEPRDPPLAEDGLYNWEDITNFWLVINPNTGLVITAPVSGNLMVNNLKRPNDLYAARNDARQMKGVGGR